jgi:hypothetical protein
MSTTETLANRIAGKRTCGRSFFGGVLLLALSCSWYSTARGQDKLKGGVLAFPSGEEQVFGEDGPPQFTSFDIVPFREGCLAFNGYFYSGTFFRGIKRKKTPQGPIFRKGHRIITQFPDEMELIVDVGPGRCAKRAIATWAGEWPPEWVKTPHAEATVIRDLKPVPLEIDLSEERMLRGEDVGIDSPFAYGIWQYWFRLTSKGVQFTDMMRFVLFSKTGEKLAELTYRP